MVDEKGDICWAGPEAWKLGAAERTRLGGGLMGLQGRRGIWKATARDWRTGLGFMLEFGLACD